MEHPSALAPGERSIRWSHAANRSVWTQLAIVDEELRDATILRFESCFELSWKMLKRRLELDVPNPSSVDQMSFKELIREGFERGYITDPSEWFLFREHRNTVAHTYDEEKAKIVFSSAVKLNLVARSLCESLKAKSDVP